MAALSLVLAFAFGEFVVRALFKDETILFPRYHTDYRYGPYTLRGIRANAQYWHTSEDGSWKFVTNSKGFRNSREFAYAKSPETLRVLSLGDSQTQGLEVRQDFTFSAVLERALGRRSVAAEVLNAGVSGFSNAEELALLEHEGAKYSPDVVVLGFFANDFEDNLKAGLFDLDASQRLVEKKFEHIPGVRIQNAIYAIPGVAWLGENSYFYSLLFNNVWNFFKARLGHAAVRQAAGHGAALPGAGDSRFEYAVPTSNAHTPHQIALAWALIERMQRFCTESKIQFIVVDIPTYEGRHRFGSSLPLALRERLDAAHVDYVKSEVLLKGFDGIAEIHVAGGTHHISELTHTLIGIEVGRRIPERK